MVKAMLKQWDKNKDRLQKYFERIVEFDPLFCERGYYDVIKAVTHFIINEGECFDSTVWEDLNKQITMVDDGDYQGTLIFIIRDFYDLYQPSRNNYFVTFIDYGSCSACDTFLSILDYETNEEKVNGLMTIARHLVSNIVAPFNFLQGWDWREAYDLVEEEE